MNVYKKTLITLLLFVFASAFVPHSAYAHPIGNSDSYFYFEKEIDGTSLSPNVIKVYSYINWFQTAFLVEKEKGIVESDIFELLKYQDVYSEYIKSHLQISNNNVPCKIEIDKTPPQEDEVSLSIGTLVISNFICDSKIENVKIQNSLFVDDFALQSNFTSIYNFEKLLHAVTIDKEHPTYEFNAPDLKAHPKGDESVDNSANMTAEEVMNSFNSGQIPNGQAVEVTAGTTMGSDTTTAPTTNVNTNNARPKKVSFLTSLTDTLFLKTNTIKDQSVLFLLVLVFLLGFLHTIEAGHSKAILASSMLHNKMDIRKGLIYAAIFTITHLGDIIIVGLILLAADQYFDILSNFGMIEKFAGYALLFMAIYMLLKNSQYLLKKWFFNNKHMQMHVHDHGHDHEHGGHTHTHDDHEHDHGHVHIDTSSSASFKEQLILGFLAGLAPCVFGWSIFMLILSTNKVWVLVPAILFFGLGIFVALAFVVFIMTHLKKGAYNKFETIAEISPIVSALFLLIYAIILVF